MGETFNPVGYALVFPRTMTFSYHLAFNQVLQYLKEQGDLDSIFDRQLAMPKCASDVGVVAQVTVVIFIDSYDQDAHCALCCIRRFLLALTLSL